MYELVETTQNSFIQTFDYISDSKVHDLEIGWLGAATSAVTNGSRRVDEHCIGLTTICHMVGYIASRTRIAVAHCENHERRTIL